MFGGTLQHSAFFKEFYVGGQFCKGDNFDKKGPNSLKSIVFAIRILLHVLEVEGQKLHLSD